MSLTTLGFWAVQCVGRRAVAVLYVYCGWGAGVCWNKTILSSDQKRMLTQKLDYSELVFA